MEETPEDAQPAPKRRSRSRVALIEATKRLLSRSAFSGFTIDDVTREADVARGTFYNQFSSLEELVAIAVQEVQDELLASVATAYLGSPDVATKMARGVMASLLYCYRHPGNTRVLSFNPVGAADPNSPRNTLLVSSLREGLANGELKFSSLDAAFATVLGVCQVGTVRMVEVLHEYSQVRELAQGLCAMILLALGVDPSRVDELAREAVQDHLDKPLGRKA